MSNMENHINGIMSGGAKNRKSSCRLHGNFTEYMQPNGKWSGCPHCALDDAHSETLSEIKDQRSGAAGRSLEKMRGDSLIPKRFIDKKVSDFLVSEESVEVSRKQRLAKTACERYINNFDERLSRGGGMIFYGGVGTGKTHLAYSIANELLEKGHPVMGIDVYELVDIVKESFSKKDGSTEREAIKRFAGALDLLVIDEIGAQLGTDFEKLLLFKVINERYKQMKPTIIISNLDEENLKDYVGIRVYDRMLEGGGMSVCFDWPSHRIRR